MKFDQNVSRCQEINTALWSLYTGTRVLIKTWWHISQVVPCHKSAGTFPRLFVIEPTYEGDKGDHTGPMVIDISYTNHVCGACSAGNLTLFSSTHTHTHVGLNVDFCLFFCCCSVKDNGHESLLFLLYVISNIVEFNFGTLIFGT